jgi:hypothetical protein
MPVPKQLHPGPGLPASDVAAHQSARIRRAMIEVVADRGYEAVKVRELVRLAGVSSRAFYELFESKESCFLPVSHVILEARQSGHGPSSSLAGSYAYRSKTLWYSEGRKPYSAQVRGGRYG